jgi:hypothetical protein
MPARIEAISLLGGKSIKYPKGHTPLHVPHCKQAKILSPSGSLDKLALKRSLNECFGEATAIVMISPPVEEIISQ